MLLNAILLVASYGLVAAEKDISECAAREGIALSSQQKEYLAQFHIIECLKGQIVIDPQLQRNCEQAEGMERLIRHVISGEKDDASAEFARQNSEAVNRVVAAVWRNIGTTPGYPSDGALMTEKWGLLEVPVLTDSTLTEIVGRDIAAGGLWGDATYLLFKRDIPGVDAAVEDILASPQSDITEKLYALALLGRRGWSPSLIARAEGIRKEPALLPEQRQVITAIYSKIQTGQPASWSDVEALVVLD
jgi:hypothetical protein